MIPKIIHYCWFGRGEMPELAHRCIESWKRLLPDYELKLWNEENFDINSNLYAQEAYQARKFAFVTDYVRLYALYHEGGIYMDADVEILRVIDEFLHHQVFSGFETDGNVPTGLMASEKGSNWTKNLLDYYSKRSFIKPDGSFDMTTNTKTITEYMLSKGLKLNNRFQIIDGAAMYPSEYFCPKDHTTGKIQLTENTYCIHHFAMSWIPDTTSLKLSRWKKKLMGVFGVKIIQTIIRIFCLRELRNKFIR